MTSKSKLYELIQLSQNGGYPCRMERPTFSYIDNFSKSLNTHNFICDAIIVIDDKAHKFSTKSFPTKKAANLNVCQQIYDKVQKFNQQPSKTVVSTTHNKLKQYDQVFDTNTDNQAFDTNTDNQAFDTNTDNQAFDTNTDNQEIIINKNLLILIDYENVSIEKELIRLQSFLDRIFIYDDDNCSDNCSDNSDSSISVDNHQNIEVIRFAGHASSMKNRADMVVRSTRKDAVDHYIGFYLGQRLGENPLIAKTHSIHVLSRDHFASCLSDFCPNVTHNVDVDHLIESITELSNTL